jgi:general nucleoside transport system ATP-binding protein
MLELIDIRKRFGDLLALDGASVRLASGRVHGLLGENGAGKSTLMNVAYGMLAPDGGQIRMNGTPVGLRSPRDAIAEGIGMVHQHFMLVPALSVLDNVLLGDRRAGRILDRKRAAGGLCALADRLGWPLDPLMAVERLSVGQQQRVEILKALWRDARVLILDEPTAVLTPPEVEQLFGAVERMRDEGRSVVFISHKLAEVKRICDDLTVLRRGRVVWEGRASEVSATELAILMIGHQVETISRPEIRGTSAPQIISESAAISAPISADVPLIQAAVAQVGRLSLERVATAGLDDVSLRIAAGEILGIAGVDGNGQQQLAEAVVGLRRITSGRISFAGRDVTALSFHDRLALGVAHIPNDRKLEALVPPMSITENLILKRHDRPPLSRAGIMSWRTAASVAQDLTESFDIRAASIEAPVGSLSGGNQQKVVLARELAMAEPKLIVAMNPVRGLDVAATNFVYQQLLARRAGGAAILLISSELDELLALCDRIGVLYAGRLTMTHFPTTGREAIGRLMAGITSPTESR